MNLTSSALGITPEDFLRYRNALLSIEGGDYGVMGGSGGKYAGAYQMGGPAIAEAAARLGEATPTTEAFLADPDMQERFMDAYTAINHGRLLDNAKYAALPPGEKLKILGYAWNQGAGGASSYLNTGKVGVDGFGTPGTKYIDAMGGMAGPFAGAMPSGPAPAPAGPAVDTPAARGVEAAAAGLAQAVRGGTAEAGVRAAEPVAGPFQAALDARSSRNRTRDKVFEIATRL